MSGNVMEWCADYYDYGFYRKAPQGVWENPLCTEEKTMRTVRGGAWNLEPWIGRTAFRLGINPNATLVNVGFRCAKEKSGRFNASTVYEPENTVKSF
jgi:formylglycine-generating enzyme required for sulfatase activity